ncbi:hypothetical protein IGI04_018581, partial [Brassica rapa subsp. trilocularis]
GLVLNEFYRKSTDSLQTPTDLGFIDNNVPPTIEYLSWLAHNQDVSAMVNASEVTGSLFKCITIIDNVGQDTKCYKIACNYVSDCQTKVNRGLASLRCPKCGNVNATEVARYRSEILAYDKDEKATFVLLGDVGPELTVVSVNYKYFEGNFTILNVLSSCCLVANPQFQSEGSDYKFTAMRQTITVTKIISIALLRPLPQAVEIPIMQVMMVTSFLGQV